MIDTCNTLFLNIAKYEPLKGSSYIPLPEVLAHKKAIINVKNQDQECLRWALKVGSCCYESIIILLFIF